MDNNTHDDVTKPDFFRKYCKECLERNFNSINFFSIAYQTIEESGLFDHSFYASQVRRPVLSDLIQDYCTLGIFEGLDPHHGFNSVFYLLINEDVRVNLLNPFVHYLKFGEKENRLPNQYEAILATGLIDIDYYNYRNGTTFSFAQEVVEFYCRFGWKLLHKPAPFFNTEYYIRNYPSPIYTYISPLADYLLFGAKMNKDASPRRSEVHKKPFTDLTERERSDYEMIQSSGSFDPAYYLSQDDVVAEADVDPLLHYVTDWRFSWLNPAPGWNTKENYKKNGCSLENPLRLSLQIPPSDTSGTLQYRNEPLASHCNPFFSVILPTWNRYSSLPLAIESALSQSYQNFELLVIDDGSDDATKRMLEFTYARQLDANKIRYFYIPHSGVSVARNRGLLEARGDWIAYLDSDNQWKKRHLEYVCDMIRKRGAKITYGKIKVFDLAENVSYLLGREFDHSSLQQSNYIDLNAFAHEKECAFHVGLFDARLTRLVDWDFILRCTQLFPPSFIDEIVCYYYILPNLRSITRSESYDRNYAILKEKKIL